MIYYCSNCGGWHHASEGCPNDGCPICGDDHTALDCPDRQAAALESSEIGGGGDAAVTAARLDPTVTVEDD